MKQNVLGHKAPPKPEQYDKNCPFYGELGVKKELITGKVVKKDSSRSATIEWVKTEYISKYERFAHKRCRLRVHNPSSVNAQIGQKVIAARTRPISKTKNHVIISIVHEEQQK